MEAGDVILWAFVQGDGRIKRRPAVLLKAVPPFNDWVLCAVSTQLERFQVSIDVRMNKTDPGFQESGLTESSIIRTAQLTTIPKRQIEGAIGRISAGNLAMIRSRLSRWFNEG